MVSEITKLNTYTFRLRNLVCKRIRCSREEMKKHAEKEKKDLPSPPALVSRGKDDDDDDDCTFQSFSLSFFVFFPKRLLLFFFTTKTARARRRREQSLANARTRALLQNSHVTVIMHSTALNLSCCSERGVSIIARECSKRLKFRSSRESTQKRPFAGKTTTKKDSSSPSAPSASLRATTSSMREDRRARSIFCGESSSRSSGIASRNNNENRRRRAGKLSRRSVEEKDEEAENNNDDASGEEKEESEEVLFDKALSKKLTTMPIPSAERKQNILLRTLTAVAITCAAIIPQISERPPTPALSVGTARTSTLVVGATKSVLEDAGLKKETDRKRSSWYAGTINL